MVRLGEFVRIYDSSYEPLYMSKTLFKVVQMGISGALIVEVDPIKNAADIDVIRGWHPEEKFHDWRIYPRLKEGHLYWYVRDYKIVKISNLISNE